MGGFADLRTRRCGLVRSLDGGQSWTRPDASPDTSSFPFCSQSQGGVIQAPVAFGGSGGGMLYMALNGWGAEEAARTGGAVLLARSANLGDSWDTVVVHNARGKTGDAAENTGPVQSLAVDRHSGKDDVVYLTFALSLPSLTAPNAAPASPMVAASRDGGRTFAETNLVNNVFEAQGLRDEAIGAATTTTAAPGATTTTTTVPPAGSKGAQPNQVANFGAAGTRNGMVARVDAKGNAYVMWPTGTANITPAPPGGLALSKSTDGGKTWSSVLAIPPSYDNVLQRRREDLEQEPADHRAERRPSPGHLGQQLRHRLPARHHVHRRLRRVRLGRHPELRPVGEGQRQRRRWPPGRVSRRRPVRGHRRRLVQHGQDAPRRRRRTADRGPGRTPGGDQAPGRPRASCGRRDRQGASQGRLVATRLQARRLTV